MDDLLNRLVGRWSLEGKMGNSALHQEVVAEWVLDGLMLQMRFSPVRIGEGGNPDYHAIYLIGRDQKTDKYVLHLFDTFGVSSHPVPGIGERRSNTLSFRFDYDSGPWFNTFHWEPSAGTWKNRITHREGGKELTFAEKELIPKA